MQHTPEPLLPTCNYQHRHITQRGLRDTPTRENAEYAPSPQGKEGPDVHVHWLAGGWRLGQAYKQPPHKHQHASMHCQHSARVHHPAGSSMCQQVQHTGSTTCPCPPLGRTQSAVASLLPPTPWVFAAAAAVLAAAAAAVGALFAEPSVAAAAAAAGPPRHGAGQLPQQQLRG